MISRVNDIEALPSTAFTVTVDGERVQACAGESVLGLLFALGMAAISIRNSGARSGAYCGMGVCFACTVCIDGMENQRACQILVREGMEILTLKNQLAEAGASDD